ncbi:MAG: Na/Pi cotransporter family protein [Bacteroidia bacterium]|nr:Na/Pi cotransporter family protein [Bacteroidia bacterium]
MNYSFLDLLTLIGSLGLFLYGMKLMSEGLQKIAGDKLRSVLTAMTKNRVIGLFTGLLITAIIQSSSATTVMVVSFVNAGLLTLTQSITVIMGANIGTTITAWIISLFGFKVSMSALALPIIAVSIPFIFSSHNKRKSFGEFLLGFALLFMGLELLKKSVPDLQSNPEILAFLTQYTGYGFGSVIIFLIIGTILTVVVQSSSATMAVTLIMCGKGWIPFELAAAMVLGENVGTTITANIAAIPANVSAKRTALSHFIFNIFGVIWMLLIFFPFINMISGIVNEYGPGDPTKFSAFSMGIDAQTMSLINNPKAVLTPDQLELKSQYDACQLSTSYGLSLFHTMFNIINSFLMIWFVKVIAKVVTFLIPQKSSDEEYRLTYISAGLLSTSELSILQADKEIDIYAKRCVKMFDIVRELYDERDPDKFDKTYETVQKYERICDRMEIEIANYLTKVAEGKLSDKSKKDVHAMLRVISEIESIGDGCNNISNIIKRKRNDNIEYSEEMHTRVYAMFDLVQKSLDEMMLVLHKTDNDRKVPDIKKSLDIEQEINDMRSKYKMQNATDVKERKYTYPISVTYMDLISECEKVGDYVINVVEQYCETKEMK